MLGANIGAVDSSIDDSFQAAGVPRPRAQIETTSVLFTLGVLDGGQHLTILPEMLVDRELRSGRFVRIAVDEAPWTRPLIVATRVRGPRAPEVAKLIALLQEVVNDVDN